MPGITTMLRQTVEAQPLIYLDELQALLRGWLNRQVSVSTICRGLQTLRITRKVLHNRAYEAPL